ncbi:MAG: hypothetical protein E6J91_52810 [Deltaproteobacteria bacterium]|nr:MAG: hypothetical protein E6J91_52810 [Deltaproteobacteria bacterium]
MSESDSESALPADVATAIEGARLVGAPTSDRDDEWSTAARAAIRIAGEVGARVVLADVSTRSWLTTPYLAGGVGADSEGLSSGEGPVGRAELELLGRQYLVTQLDEAAAVGVEAEVWLATKPGIRSLPLFLERFPDIDVLVGPPLDSPSMGQWLVGDRIDGVRSRAGGRTMIVAHPDGRLTLDHGESHG